MSIKCCYKCVPPKRHTACWDTCPDYQQEKAKDVAQKEAERKKRLIDYGIREQRSRAVKRAIKSQAIPERRKFK